MRLTGVDLNLLVAFDALTAERSVTRAAERLSVGQSAMSATLGRLRRLFDDPLLVRQGRTLVPTSVAESLVEPVREALTVIEQTLTVRSRFDPTRDHRTFSVMASDYVILVLLRPLLAELADEAPHVRLHIRAIGPDFVERLRRHETDLLVIPDDLLDHRHDYPRSPLFTDHYVCVVDRANLDVGEQITTDQFRRQPYLAYSAGALESLAERQLDAAGISRNLEVSAESMVIASYLVAGTRLITLVPERLARAARATADIRVLEPPVPLRPITEVMTWTPRHDNDAAHRWLRDRLTDLAARI